MFLFVIIITECTHFYEASIQEMIGKKGGLKALVKCLKSEDEQVQRWAVFAVGNLVNTSKYSEPEITSFKFYVIDGTIALYVSSSIM